jgi:prophage regulatory protein
MSKFWRLPQVLKRYPVGRSTLYEMVRAGTFPAPVKLSSRAVAWVDEELDEHDERLLAEREGKPESEAA